MSNYDILAKTKFNPSGFALSEGSKLNQLLQQVVSPLQPLKIIPDTAHTLTGSETGKMLLFTNAAGCTLTLPSNLPGQFNVAIVQLGAAQVTIAAGSGATINNAGSFTKTAAIYAVCSLLVYSNNVGLTAASALTFGNMA